MFAFTKLMQAMATAAGSYTVVQTFTASGTWTAPTEIGRAHV